jgi:hypothetical protein
MSSASELEYEGYVRYADSTVISVQCTEGRCHECPDETTGSDGECGPRGGVLDGQFCEHGCEHGPAAGRKRIYSPALCLPLRVAHTTGKRLHVIMAADGAVLTAIEDEPGALPLWVTGLAQLPEVTVTPSVYRTWKRTTPAFT